MKASVHADTHDTKAAPFAAAIAARVQRCGRAGCPCVDEGSLDVRRSGHGQPAAAASEVVREVLSEPGQPLDSATQRHFQEVMGHDFGDVRVHADERGARAATSLAAYAWTAGTHVVFAQGQYAPHTKQGRQLLAHELTHVTQQRRSGNTQSPFTIDDDSQAEGEAQHAAALLDTANTAPLSMTTTGVQRQPDPSGRLLPVEQLRLSDEFQLRPGSIPEAIVVAPRGAPADVRLEPPSFLSPPRPRTLLPDMQLQLPLLEQFGTVIFLPRCVPDRPLTWADFAGSPQANSTFSAKTFAPITETTVQGNPMFQTRFNSASSWVRQEFKDPTNRKVNGCQPKVNQCIRFLRGSGPGAFWTYGGQPSPTCAASAVPATVRANTQAECDTVVGAECDRAAAAESARLLHHEQRHFDIACRFAHKANDALRSGTPITAIRPAISAKHQPAQAAYDADSAHGCNAAGQATWDGTISSGLPAMTIP